MVGVRWNAVVVLHFILFGEIFRGNGWGGGKARLRGDGGGGGRSRMRRFEPIGSAGCCVRSLAMADGRIVDAVDRGNVGLVVRALSFARFDR